MKKLNFIMLVWFVCLLGAVKANNLQITNIGVNQTTKIVSFTVSWDNSWRVTAAPGNWDAVWLFVKFRACSATSATAYTSGILSATTADHTYTGAEAMKSVNWNGSTGIKESVVQGAALDFTEGIMLRRNTVGSGSFSSNVSLKITNLPASGIDITTSVSGLEMVYVPKGDFYLGDGINSGSAFRFGTTTATGTALSIAVDSTSETLTTQTYVTVAQAGTTGIPAAWPKGHCGFYIMKYEITEGAYAQFLNTITATAAAARYPGNYGTNRNLLGGSGPYTAFRPDRAQNFLIWADVSAFLDWACLRPITETEFEKAARGPLAPVTNEYAWGSTGISPGTNFTSGETGFETFTGGNCAYNNLPSYGGLGDGGAGPCRVGIFATNASDRTAAGASYYGAMDLSGNVMEWTICMNIGTPANNVFKRVWGDGNLDVTGQHDVALWPAPASSPLSGIANIVGLKGGDWTESGALLIRLQTSDRTFMCSSVAAGTRLNYMGGRGGR